METKMVDTAAETKESAKGDNSKPIGYLTEIDGVTYYRIDDVGTMEPFLMSVFSSSDLWMFASSQGTLTAGRIDADHALLPYETVDRIHRQVGLSGPITILAREVEGRRELWQPFGVNIGSDVSRSLAKSVFNDRLIYEETNEEWGLRYRVTWAPAPSLGWVRTVELTDVDGLGAELELVDGLLDVMPSGVPAGVEQSLSNFVDAYKRSEVGRWDTAAIYTVEAMISDRSEPAESLGATTIWSFGTTGFDVHLDERVVRAMLAGQEWPTTDLLTGRRGAYLLRGNLTLPAMGAVAWSLVADTALDHAQVRSRAELASNPEAPSIVQRDVTAGADQLERLLADADGFQKTGEPLADAHHLSNVLLNSMRGGVFLHGHLIPINGFADHIRRWNHDVYDRHLESVSTLGSLTTLDHLLATADATADPDLIRLVLEYLPLAFSRRHGDPSRPWNQFSIHVHGKSGEEILAYQGNWRDIFQNWEAMMMSYPAFFGHAVAKFVNASTVDGHNPYRITEDGVDWEVPDPHDPWSNIGYWGDHQIVYLHRLLAQWQRFDASAIRTWLDQPVFVYADVPYTIAGYRDATRDPRNTIIFDTDRADQIEDRVRDIGNDGRLLVDGAGDLARVTLIEKLLVPALAKLTVLIPGGGIWMNTQRPEWNDANNALAGFGLSMVTAVHLYGYLRMLRELLDDNADATISLSVTVAQWFTNVSETLESFSGRGCHEDDHLRGQFAEAMGEIGDRHRAAAKSSFDATPVGLTSADLDKFFSAALSLLKDSIDAAQDPDGLLASYNLVSFGTENEVRVDRLGPMLEGQVALLSGFLNSTESLELIETLYTSDMYRADEKSFMLYPPRRLPAFLDKNSVSGDNPQIAPLLADLADAGIVVEDHQGDIHFTPDMINASELRGALDSTGLSDSQRDSVLDVYESTFNHHAYTGRSGSMYGYEGIGSIYWHMIGKLLVAVQETYWAAVDLDEPAEIRQGLAAAYRRIRTGLGFLKDPADWGAIPTDCYSHTPAHAGAKQPGMTGQVKEIMLTRFGELGFRIANGQISLSPGLLELDELIDDKGTAEFSFCGTKVQIDVGDSNQVRVRRDDEWSEPAAGLVLDHQSSLEVLSRSGVINGLWFTIDSTSSSI